MGGGIGGYIVKLWGARKMPGRRICGQHMDPLLQCACNLELSNGSFDTEFTYVRHLPCLLLRAIRIAQFHRLTWILWLLWFGALYERQLRTFEGLCSQ
jgi:hypothetical protein